MDELERTARTERWLRDWGALALIVLGLAVLGLGLVVPGFGAAVSRSLFFAAGPILCAVASYHAYDRPVRNRWLPALVLLAAMAVAELAAVSAVLLPDDVGRAAVARDGVPSARIEAPASSAFRLRVRTRSSRPMEITLSVERGDARRTLDLSLEDDLSWNERTLRLGQGRELVAQIVDADGSAAVEIAIAPPRRRLFFWWMSPLVFAMAIAAQGALARHGQRAPLGASAGALCVFALVLHGAPPDAGIRFAAGALLAAGVAGGLGGWVLGGAAALLARRRRPDRD